MCAYTFIHMHIRTSDIQEHVCARRLTDVIMLLAGVLTGKQCCFEIESGLDQRMGENSKFLPDIFVAAYAHDSCSNIIKELTAWE